MLNLLLSDTNATPQKGSWVIYVILIVLVVIMLVLPSVTNRRRMKEYNQMLDRLRVGDEVRTIGGIIGRVVKINNKGEIKTFTLETGSKGNKTTMEFDIASVGTVLKSTYVDEAPVKEEPKVLEEVKLEQEETQDEELVNEEEIKIEKPKAKKTSKKSSKK